MDTPSSYAAKLPSIVSPFLAGFSRPNESNYVFVASFPLLALLAVFFVTRGWSRFRPNVPFALEDEFPSRNERVQQYVRNSREVLVKGYSKLKDQIFAIDTPLGCNIVLPIRFMDELKSNPNLSFSAALNEFTLERYTKVGALPAWSIKLFSAKFNPALDSYAEIFQNMAGEHIANLLLPAHGKDWASINVWSSIIPLITKSNVRGFLGSDAAEDEVFLDVAGTFIINQIVYSIGAKQWPSFLLPIVHKYLPGFPGLAEQYSNGAEVVLRQMKNKKANGLKPLSDPPSVFDYVNDDGQYLDDLQLQMNIQMPLCAASIHTTTSTVVQCLYDLASRPEYLPALRQEIQEVTNEHGDVLTRRVASKLEKMDSFIKEVQRFCSPDLTTFQRKATGPVTLSNGFHLPKGARIEVATGAINADAALYDNPSEFDGLRFYKKRQTEEARSKYQVLSVSKEDLAWGYGRAACPGRFLADMLIKMILVEVLKRYDIKMPDGQGRYENMEVQGQTLPNEQGEILIRERD
ncbi:Cytochrome P450 monooxygenase BOA4 [Colletotrichum siamense]|nr:Cytochrome P450 monooxygenase BOA4 [Colletotrichum siamense]